MQEQGVSKAVGVPDRVRGLARDAVAGLIASIVLIANTVSLAALIFSGPLAQGSATAIWAMLVGSAVAGVWIAWKTSIPPLATAVDSPTGAVLVLLSASAGPAVLGAGGSTQAAIEATMLMFSAATVLSALLLLGLGAARWGRFLRFVPYFVVAGFLAATGWLLIVGAVRMSTGHTLGQLIMQGTPTEAARLASALLVLGVLLGLKRWVRSALALPIALLAMTLGGATALRGLGLSDPAQGWYLPSLGALVPWTPLEAWQAAPMTPSMALGFLPEVVAAAIVALVSLVTKTSALEVARKASGDLDNEMRAHGVGNLVAAVFGGVASNLQLGSSRLLDLAGAASRWSGVMCAAVLGVVGLASVDLPALVPLPIAAGLVLYLGYGFLAEALAKPIAQRAWLNLLLALAIMAACVRYGYLAGVMGGIVGASLLFAGSYARIGVVRQHLSRSQFAGNVSRSAEAARRLGESGEAIQIYWLCGYIFFGSSESVFERVRDHLRSCPPRQVRYVILDLRMVTGADASAPVSLAKLRNLCRQQAVTLVFSSVDATIRAALAREGFFGAKDAEPQPFLDVNAALAWCEDRLLDGAWVDAASSDAGAARFAAWLQQELGVEMRLSDFMPYLERREFEGAMPLYRQGDAADAIDLVAAGRLLVHIETADGAALHVRSITTQTVVGEMGFFRRTPRSATVSSDGPVTLFTMTRTNFERLRNERPELAMAFDEFLLRTLADRLVLTERMVAALAR